MNSKVEFRDVTVLYDDKIINRKICKQKDIFLSIVIALFFVVSAIIAALIFFSNTPTIYIALLSILFLFGPLILYWLYYRNTAESFDFMDWVFALKEVDADTYKDNIILRVMNSDEVRYLSLDEFTRLIPNNITITNNSEQGKPIHVTIDITNDSKTEVLIKNK